jgi:alpha-tubulin suppressor-like RCC1 family protein
MGLAFSAAACGAASPLPGDDGGGGSTAREGECGAPCDGEIVDVGTGRQHSCVLYDSGGVVCWGMIRGRSEDRSVRLGDGPPPAVKPAPVPVEGLGHARQLSVGAAHTCVVDGGETLLCWGRNELGQIDGTAEDRLVPVTVKEAIGLVAAGDDRTYVWSAPLGEDGPGAHPYDWVTYWPPWPGMAMSKIIDVLQLSTGWGHHACLLSDTPSFGAVVSCCGSNERGQAGGSDSPPGCAPPVEEIVGPVSVAAGLDHTCVALESGRVLCFGANDYGQLGTSETGRGGHEPVEVVGLADAVWVAAKEQRSCAVRATGEVACWGRAGDGFLGEEGPDDASQPTPVGIAGLDDAVRVSIGEHHACALKRSGEVVCWGSNLYGEAGFAGDFSRVPLPVVGLP